MAKETNEPDANKLDESTEQRPVRPSEGETTDGTNEIPPQVREDDPIYKKVFNANQVWEGKGGTSSLRLDEINAILESRDRGGEVIMGDASAYDLVDRLLTRAGVVGHWFWRQCAEAMSEAILRVVGDSPAEFTNPTVRHSARAVHARALGFNVDPDVDRADHSDKPNGYPKPTAEEAEKTRKAQEDVTAREKAGGSSEVSQRGKDGTFSEEEFNPDTAHTQQAKTTGTSRGKSSGSSSRSTSKHGKPEDKNDDEVRKLLGDGEN